MALMVGVGEVPWWGVSALAGAFGLAGLLLGAILESVRQRGQRREARSTRWDERRLELFVKIAGHLHDGYEAMKFAILDTTTDERKAEHRAAAARAYMELKPLLRELSLLQMTSTYAHVQQAHAMLASSTTGTYGWDELDYLSRQILTAEQGMRKQLGTPSLHAPGFKGPKTLVHGWWSSRVGGLRRDLGG